MLKKRIIAGVSSLVLLCTPIISFAKGDNNQGETMITDNGKMITVEQIDKEMKKIPVQAQQEVEKSFAGTNNGLVNKVINVPKQIKVYDPVSKKSKSYSTKTLFAANEIPGIIGKDNRTRVTNTKKFPYRASGLIIAQFGKDYYSCSGSYIDRNTVLTAGHCLYLPETGQTAKNIYFYPAANADSRGRLIAPYGSAKGVRISIPQGWKKGNLNYDYGVFSTDKSLGKKTGYYGLREANTLKGQTVTALGYPAMKPSYTMWKDSGKVFGETSRMMKYYIDTTGGQSGGPVYRYSSKYGYYAIGVISHGYINQYNVGTKLAPKAYKAVKYWAAKY